MIIPAFRRTPTRSVQGARLAGACRPCAAPAGDGGIGARLDPERGFDHGVFSIMKPLYPGEDIPLVQLSIDRSYDPELHLKLGRLLAPLRTKAC
jgi:aromatic ring-opening dioxygenase catalytic subunit (LigB family)